MLFGDNSEEDKKEENTDDDSYFGSGVHVVNAICMLYSGAFFLMLFCFGINMHASVMNNVTTNESLRKKWNANNLDERRGQQRVKTCDKYRYFYCGKLPVSRI